MPGQNYGYEENEEGDLSPQHVAARDATLGPAYYNVSHVRGRGREGGRGGEGREGRREKGEGEGREGGEGRGGEGRGEDDTLNYTFQYSNDYAGSVAVGGLIIRVVKLQARLMRPSWYILAEAIPVQWVLMVWRIVVLHVRKFICVLQSTGGGAFWEICVG